MNQNKVQLYLLPGLGVDHRLFHRLKIPNNVQAHYWNWEAPNSQESLEDYSKRYADKIIPQLPSIILGVSFGGIVAQEISKLIAIEKVLLISSIKHRKEIPWYFSLGQTFPVYSWVAPQQIKWIGASMQRALGDRGEGALLFESMLANTPDEFMPWAIHQLIHWKQEQPPEHVVHYHGTNDHVLPAKFISDYIPIEGGTHAMIMVKAAKMNAILEKELIVK